MSQCTDTSPPTEIVWDDTSRTPLGVACEEMQTINLDDMVTIDFETGAPSVDVNWTEIDLPDNGEDDIVEEPATASSKLQAFEDLEAILVCLDVEAHCHNYNITELGIDTLDLRDVANVSPGDRGRNWFSHIRKRHLRVRDNLGLSRTRLHEVLNGDKFLFGHSEWITAESIKT